MIARKMLPVGTSEAMAVTAFRAKIVVRFAMAVLVTGICGVAKEAKSGELETLAESAEKELAQAKEQASVAAAKSRKASSETVEAQRMLRGAGGKDRGLAAVRLPIRQSPRCG